MPFQLQALARGLINLLELQSDGKGPSALSEVLVPTVDTTDLYLAARAEGLALTVSTPISGTNIVGFVPANEVWVVEQMNAFGLSGDAGVSFRIAPMANAPKDITSYPILFAQPQQVTALNAAWAVGRSQRIYLPAGTRLAVYCTDVVGAPTALSVVAVHLWFTRLRMGA